MPDCAMAKGYDSYCGGYAQLLAENKHLRAEMSPLRGQLEKDQALIMRLCVERERLIAALEEIESHGDQHRETCRSALAGKAPG